MIHATYDALLELKIAAITEQLAKTLDPIERELLFTLLKQYELDYNELKEALQ